MGSDSKPFLNLYMKKTKVHYNAHAPVTMLVNLTKAVKNAKTAMVLQIDIILFIKCIV